MSLLIINVYECLVSTHTDTHTMTISHANICKIYMYGVRCTYYNYELKSMQMWRATLFLSLSLSTPHLFNQTSLLIFNTPLKKTLRELSIVCYQQIWFSGLECNILSIFIYIAYDLYVNGIVNIFHSFSNCTWSICLIFCPSKSNLMWFQIQKQIMQILMYSWCFSASLIL